MNVFFDSSAWAKRYLDEDGSEKVEKLCSRAAKVTLSILCVPELISAFSRLRREEKIDEEQFELLKNRLLREIRDVHLINLTPEVIFHAVELLQEYELRTLDALHIACAVTADISLFVTADKRQMAAAEGLNLNAEWAG
jgi:predicted nucleic acid-binding protein